MRHTANVDYEIEQEGVAKHLLHNLMATQISKNLQLYCHGTQLKASHHKSKLNFVSIIILQQAKFGLRDVKTE